VDIEKLSKIYGLGIVDIINDNSQLIKDNINYLTSLGFSCVGELFSRYPSLFVFDEEEFKIKVDSLVLKVGLHYLDFLENDLTMFEVLL